MHPNQHFSWSLHSSSSCQASHCSCCCCCYRCPSLTKMMAKSDHCQREEQNYFPTRPMRRTNHFLGLFATTNLQRHQVTRAACCCCCCCETNLELEVPRMYYDWRRHRSLDRGLLLMPSSRNGVVSCSSHSNKVGINLGGPWRKSTSRD